MAEAVSGTVLSAEQQVPTTGGRKKAYLYFIHLYLQPTVKNCINCGPQAYYSSGRAGL